MNQPNDTEKKNAFQGDEIDIRVVYNIIVGLFSGTWGVIVKITHIMKKRWLLVFIFGILGLGAGIGLFSITTPSFTRTLTLSSSVLTNDYCSDLIEDLNNIIEDDTPNLLANRLNIDTNVAQGITRIEYFNYDEKLKEKYDDRDTVVLGLPFKVIVTSIDNSVFSEIQSAIVNYLESNKYATKKKEIKKQNLKLMQDKINYELIQLDSLKKNLTNNMSPRGNASGFVFGQPIDPINIYKEGISFFQRELDINRDLELINNIQVINEFSPRSKPDKPILMIELAKGILAGLFFGVMLAFLLESRKK